ncbi:MAG: alpha-galactosidase, partial [Clostridia bacterium]
SKKINAMGMKFGLWFEPEMINENSNLYRTHPDWAVKHPDYEASLCRNQMLLDYTNPLVTDYIKKQLSIILESANIDYVKWDFNRPMSDFYSTTLFNQGEFFHRYMLGLYDVLDYLTKKFPYILFESCASGGSRVDLGMLCFMPQFWTSDNTDSFDRFLIQEGTSLCYPLSSIGAHVSASLNHQTLRKSRISTRFNTACFGAFGYELNLNTLSNKDISNIEKQVEFYKLYRPVFQYGDFYRLVDVFKEDYGGWIVISKDKTIAFALLQNKIAPTNPPLKILKTKGLNDNFLYSFSAIIEDINIKTFGSLINLVSPVKLKENGLIHNIADKFYYLKTESDSFTAYGSLLNNAGVKLSREWSGSGYNDNVRLMQDFGSRLYIIKSIKQN